MLLFAGEMKYNCSGCWSCQRRVIFRWSVNDYLYRQWVRKNRMNLSGALEPTPVDGGLAQFPPPFGWGNARTSRPPS